MEKKEFDLLWKAPVIRIGTSTLLLAVILSFIPLGYLYLTHGVLPSLATALTAWGMVATVFAAFYFVEPISFYSILGLSGTYMSFLAGNISNLRLPCAAVALDVTGTEAGTQEAEIISTLGIAGSILTNIVGITLCALAGAAILRLVPPAVADSLRLYTVPAIFGAMFGQFTIKYPQVAIFGLGIPVAIRLLAPATPAYLIIVSAVFGTMAVARLFYNAQKKKSTGVSA